MGAPHLEQPMGPAPRPVDGLWVRARAPVRGSACHRDMRSRRAIIREAGTALTGALATASAPGSRTTPPVSGPDVAAGTPRGPASPVALEMWLPGVQADADALAPFHEQFAQETPGISGVRVKLQTNQDMMDELTAAPAAESARLCGPTRKGNAVAGCRWPRGAACTLDGRAPVWLAAPGFGPGTTQLGRLVRPAPPRQERPSGRGARRADRPRRAAHDHAEDEGRHGRGGARAAAHPLHGGDVAARRAPTPPESRRVGPGGAARPGAEPHPDAADPDRRRLAPGHRRLPRPGRRHPPRLARARPAHPRAGR
jgi:hypothetical protein